MHYTLAGPDIGVRKLDLAGLTEILGEDLAMWAASAANHDAPIEIPNQTKPRVIRVHKGGDEGLGYDYFAKRVRDPIVAAPENPSPPKAEDDDKPMVELTAERVANGTAAGEIAIYEVEVPLTIRIPLRLHVFAPPGAPDEAAAAVRRMAENDAQPDNVGVIFDPEKALATALRALIERDADFERAGWRFEVGEVKEHPAEYSRRLGERIYAEQIRHFEAHLGTYMDRMLDTMTLAQAGQ
jgi:hypothetical protein